MQAFFHCSDSSVGGYVPTPDPTYSPGDDVIVCNSPHGWENLRGRVTRVVPIAPLSDTTVRYLYLLDLEGAPVSRLTADEETLRPIHSDR
ncbi:MAG TPA: hypothetical protein VF120_05925 [Ktedonobacterales bacterium]